MPIIKVQRTQAAKSGQPEDATVNSFYFSVPAPVTSVIAGQVTAALDAFFNTATGGGTAVRVFMAESTMAANQNSYKVYNLDDTKPRVPIFTPAAQNVTPLITTAALPSEVCVCLSFRAQLISGTAAGRRRGRVYIGPLNTAALEPDPVTGQARVAAALGLALVAGANKMHDDLTALNIFWGVYSETARGGGAADLGFIFATDCWVDNAFDTQRRRGQRANARQTMAM